MSAVAAVARENETNVYGRRGMRSSAIKHEAETSVRPAELASAPGAMADVAFWHSDANGNRLMAAKLPVLTTSADSALFTQADNDVARTIAAQLRSRMTRARNTRVAREMRASRNMILIISSSLRQYLTSK